jgi:hypothetical protein
MHLVAGALVSLSALVLPVQDTSLPTVTGELECPANEFVVTVDNPGDLTFQVEVTADGDPYASVTVGPDSVVDIAVAMDDFDGDPVFISITGDNDFPETLFPVFFCPLRMDYSVTTPESTALVIDLFGPCSWSETMHGTVESAGLNKVLYTPDPGFAGVDSFDYECGASVNSFGTVTITVTDPPAPAHAPVASVVEPTFTG